MVLDGEVLFDVRCSMFDVKTGGGWVSNIELRMLRHPNQLSGLSLSKPSEAMARVPVIERLTSNVEPLCKD